MDFYSGGIWFQSRPCYRFISCSSVSSGRLWSNILNYAMTPQNYILRADFFLRTNSRSLRLTLCLIRDQEVHYRVHSRQHINLFLFQFISTSSHHISTDSTLTSTRLHRDLPCFIFPAEFSSEMLNNFLNFSYLCGPPHFFLVRSP
jgi:hypothetical protein